MLTRVSLQTPQPQTPTKTKSPQIYPIIKINKRKIYLDVVSAFTPKNWNSSDNLSVFPPQRDLLVFSSTCHNQIFGKKKNASQFNQRERDRQIKMKNAKLFSCCVYEGKVNKTDFRSYVFSVCLEKKNSIHLSQMVMPNSVMWIFFSLFSAPKTEFSRFQGSEF